LAFRESTLYFDAGFMPRWLISTTGTWYDYVVVRVNGNVTGGLGRGYSWFSFNKPLQVS
jgi:hypothetical protein